MPCPKDRCRAGSSQAAAACNTHVSVLLCDLTQEDYNEGIDAQSSQFHLSNHHLVRNVSSQRFDVMLMTVRFCLSTHVSSQAMLAGKCWQHC